MDDSLAFMERFRAGRMAFRPFPDFCALAFHFQHSSAFFLPLIMVSQNLEKRRDEIRAESDFEINLKAEKETEAILSKLEEQDEKISKILEEIKKIV